MSGTKWEEIHQQFETPMAQFFKEPLVTYLKMPLSTEFEGNQPGKILQEAVGGVGKLSRIFDEFQYPVPSYEEIKVISSQPNGLRNYMQECLNNVLPHLLAPDRTSLNPQIREAIGGERYQALQQAASDQEIAKQFVQAIFVSFTQRIIDISTKEEAAEIYNSIGPEMTALAKEVTLQGLPIKSASGNDDEKINDLKRTIEEFHNLLLEAENAGIQIPNAKRINDKLNEALDKMDPDIGLTKTALLDQMRSSYDKAVDLYVDGLKDNMITAPPAPKEANLFIKILRFIFRSEKLLQSNEEKRYDRQMTLLPKIQELEKQLDKSLEKSATDNKEVIANPTPTGPKLE